MIEPQRRFLVSGRDRETIYTVTMADAEMARLHADRWLATGFTEVKIIDQETGAEVVPGQQT
jgi:hypothetical protein